MYQSCTTIRGKLCLLLLAVLLPTLTIKAIEYYHQFREREAIEFEDNLEVARVAAKTFEGFVQDIVHQELAIGINLTSDNPLTTRQMNRILEKNRADYPAVGSFSWLSPRGVVLASSMESTVGMDMSQRTYLQEILAAKTWTLSDLLLSRATGKPIFTISRRIRDEKGRLVGIVVAGILPQKLGNLMNVQRNKEGTITLFDRQGRAVLRDPAALWNWRERGALMRNPMVRRALEGKEVTAVIPRFFHQGERMAALVRVDSNGWVVGASRPIRKALQPIISHTIDQSAFFALLVVVVFVGAMLFSKRIVAPLKELHSHALDIGRGRMGQRVAMRGARELRDLAAAFNTMTEEVRKREEALKSERLRLFSVLEAMPAFVYLQAPDDSIRYANRTFRETFGDPEGKNCLAWPTGAKEPCSDCMSSSIFEERSFADREWTSPAGGSYRLFERPFADIDGSPLVLRLGVDVTEQKKTEAALKRSEARYRAVVENQTELIVRCLPDGTLTFANPAYCRYFGESPEQVIGEKLWHHIPSADQRKFRDHLRALGKENPVAVIEHRVIDASGELSWQQWTDQAICNENGEVVEFQGVGRDITKLIKAQETLKTSEMKYRSIFNAAKDAIILVDTKTGEILDVNESACGLYGYSHEEMLLLKKVDLSAEPGETLRASQSELSWIPFRHHRKKNGSVFPVEISSRHHAQSGRRVTTSVIRDVTERKRFEEALRKSEKKFRTIFENSPLGILHLDQTGTITECNDKAVEIIGLSRDQLSEINLLSFPLREEKMRTAIDTCFSGKPGHFEGRYHSAIGGRKTTPLKADLRPILADDGTVSGAIGVLEDFTERIRAEESLRESEKQLRQLSRQLLVAQEEERKRIAVELHDSIGASLSAIKVNLRNLLGTLEEGSKPAKSVETLISVTQQTIDEARKIMTALRPSMLDDLGIVSTIDSFCDSFQELYDGIFIEQDIRVEEQDIPEDLKIVIYRVMQEAFHNIAKYSRAEFVGLSLKRNDGTLEFTIEDNGAGFDLDATCSRQGNRKGLGLSSMRERTELSGGSFHMQSSREEGTMVQASWKIPA